MTPKAGSREPARLCRDVAQPGRALAWGARGRQFKSARPDHLLLISSPSIPWDIRGRPTKHPNLRRSASEGAPVKPAKGPVQGTGYSAVQICPSRPFTSHLKSIYPLGYSWLTHEAPQPAPQRQRRRTSQACEGRVDERSEAEHIGSSRGPRRRVFVAGAEICPSRPFTSHLKSIYPLGYSWPTHEAPQPAPQRQQRRTSQACEGTGPRDRQCGSSNLPVPTIKPLVISSLCRRSSSAFFFHLSSCDVIVTLSNADTAFRLASCRMCE